MLRRKREKKERERERGFKVRRDWHTLTRSRLSVRADRRERAAASKREEDPVKESSREAGNWFSGGIRSCTSHSTKNGRGREGERKREEERNEHRVRLEEL